jgi:hypothetical protein
METLKVEVTGKTVNNKDLKNCSMKMETLSLDVTLKTIFHMDFGKRSLKVETQKELNNM